MKTIDADIFLERCRDDWCDGSHCIVKIGHDGKPAIARYVTDAAGARQLAALFCQIAIAIEALGLAVKPP